MIRLQIQWLLIITTVLVVGTVVIFAVRYVQRQFQGVHNMYAVWNIAEYIIEHLETHDDRWPEGWRHLEDAYLRKRGGELDPQRAKDVIADLRQLVAIDFNVNVDQLRQALFLGDEAQPPFRVVRHLREPHAYVSGREPNSLIWRYLNRNAPFDNVPRPATTQSASRPSISATPQ